MYFLNQINYIVIAKQAGMKRYGSLSNIKRNNYVDDEEGLIYEESKGFDISPQHRRK